MTSAERAAVLDRVVSDLAQRDDRIWVDADQLMTTHDAAGDLEDSFTLREIVEAVLRNLD